MKFTHLRDDYGNLFATVANDEVGFGVAVCSDADQFARKKGRNIAANRLENGYSVIPDSPRLVMYKGQEVYAADVVELFVNQLELAEPMSF